jgi:hypothetical protein
MECAASWSVEAVGAVDRTSAVRGADPDPSADEGIETRLWESFDTMPAREVESDGLLCGLSGTAGMRQDCG